MPPPFSRQSYSRLLGNFVVLSGSSPYLLFCLRIVVDKFIFNRSKMNLIAIHIGRCASLFVIFSFLLRIIPPRYHLALTALIGIIFHACGAPRITRFANSQLFSVQTNSYKSALRQGTTSEGHLLYRITPEELAYRWFAVNNAITVRCPSQPHTILTGPVRSPRSSRLVVAGKYSAMAHRRKGITSVITVVLSP